MKILKRNTLIIASFILMFCAYDVLSSPNHDDIKIQRMQEIYFYAKKYYNEGEYDKSIEEFEKILKLSPGHAESIRMIKLNKKKLQAKQNEINAKKVNQAKQQKAAVKSAEPAKSKNVDVKEYLKKGQEYYNKGAFLDALDYYRKAYKAAPADKEIKVFYVRILTELGMEYSLLGKHSKAIEYLEEADKADPGNKDIEDMINISRSMLPQEAEEVDQPSEPVEVSGSMEEMKKLFEDYQKNQKQLLDESMKNQATLQKIIEKSEQEKTELFNVMKEREKIAETLLGRLKGYIDYFLDNLIVFSSALGLLTALAAVASFRKKQKVSKIRAKNEAMQEKLVETLEENAKKKNELTDYEKKLKKLIILEKELISDNGKELMVGYKILEEFFHDVDYRIRLKAISILHKINSAEALERLETIISREKGEIKIAACELLGEIKSNEAVELLLKLSQKRDEDLKKAVLASLVKIANSDSIEASLKSRVADEIENIYAQGDWIVV